jgi:hypothetical protein
LEILKAHDDRLTYVSHRDDGAADAINKGFARAWKDSCLAKMQTIPGISKRLASSSVGRLRLIRTAADIAVDSL